MNEYTNFTEREDSESITGIIQQIKKQFDEKQSLSSNNEAKINKVDSLKFLIEYIEMASISLHNSMKVYVNKDKTKAIIFNQNTIYESCGEEKSVTQFNLKDFRLTVTYESFCEIGKETGIVYPAKINKVNLKQGNEIIEISHDESIDPEGFNEIAKQVIFNYNNVK